MKRKEVYINDKPYLINLEDYFKLESVQYEMQELVNNDKFKSEDYNNLKKLFSSFLKKDLDKKRTKKISSDVFYYTY